MSESAGPIVMVSSGFLTLGRLAGPCLRIARVFWFTVRGGHCYRRDDNGCRGGGSNRGLFRYLVVNDFTDDLCLNGKFNTPVFNFPIGVVLLTCEL